MFSTKTFELSYYGGPNLIDRGQTDNLASPMKGYFMKNIWLKYYMTIMKKVATKLKLDLV